MRARERESRMSRRGNGGSGDTQSKVNDARTAKRSAATDSRLLRTLPSQRKKYTDERCIASSSARVLIKHQRQPSDDVSESNESGRQRPPSTAGVRFRKRVRVSATSMVPVSLSGTRLNHTNKQERLGAGKIRSVKAMAQEGSVCVRAWGCV